MKFGGKVEKIKIKKKKNVTDILKRRIQRIRSGIHWYECAVILGVTVGERIAVFDCTINGNKSCRFW